MLEKAHFNFVSKFPLAVVASTVLMLGALSLFFTKGLNYGVDFRGGAEIQIKFAGAVKLQEIRDVLEKNKYASSSVQSIGEASAYEFLIKVPGNEENLNKVTEEVEGLFQKDFADRSPQVRKTDIVGPKAGEQLRISGFQAMAWALIMIMVYIGLRFDYKYSPGAIVALFHDVVIIVGVFILTGKEFGLQIVGALLAVIGYSVNDTVVVYDRVREHEVSHPERKITDSINIALNETLSRTTLTSLTTFLVAIVMYIFGGAGIEDFFFAICLGVIVGTYSSLFVAAPTVLFFDRLMKKKD